MNPFNDIVIQKGEDGRAFQLHWKNRYTGAELLLLAGAGAVAAGQVQQGRIAKAQGDFAEKVAQRNQQSLERQAKAERDAASIDEERISRRSKIVQARLKVGSAKSNIGLAGASLDALSDAAFQFSLDRNLTLRHGLIRSRELLQRGKILSAEGKFASTVGKAKRTSAFISAAGTVLSAASKFGGADSAKSGITSKTKISSRNSFPTAAKNFPGF
jgi:hypothetical protein